MLHSDITRILLNAYDSKAKTVVLRCGHQLYEAAPLKALEIWQTESLSESFTIESVNY